VSRLLADAERLAAQLRQQAFQDPVTGLANRRQFMDVLEHRLADPELSGAGALLLVQLNGLRDLNQARGYAAGDALLRGAADAIRSALAEQHGATIAHLAGGDFAVLLEGVDDDRLRTLGTDMLTAIGALYRPLDLPSPDVAHAGGTHHRGQSATELLAEADLALREAQREGANTLVVHEEPAGTVRARPASAWRRLIEDALATGAFHLLRQPVVGCADRSLLHHEVFLRIDDPDQPGASIPAAVFMPVVEHVGLAAAVDRAALGRVLDAMQAGEHAAAVAVNLSGASLADPALLDWLAERVGTTPSLGAGLILEFPEYGATARLDDLERWIGRLGPLGVRFSLDHFGKGFSSFAYLRNLHFAYLKVDGSFVRHLDRHDDNRFFLRTIAEIAHGLDMQVIAESVETEASWQALAELGVDGGRGYWLGAPV